MSRRWVLVLTAVATLLSLALPVNGNLRYEVGVHRASDFGVADTFSHRPITFRLLSAAHAWLPNQLHDLFGEPDSLLRVRAFESGFRGIAALAAAAAALLLWAGLRRRWGSAAWPYAVAGYAALLFTAPATGEPDWLAVLLAVAAVGTGLLGGPWLGGAAGGVLLALAALVKITSLPVALAALLILWSLDRRRGWIAAAAAGLAGLLAVAAILLWAPHEIAWLLDIRALQPDPWTRRRANEAGHYVANLAARWPAVALLPAFFVGATRGEALTALSALALTGFAVAFQGQYFVYHALALVTLSTALAVRTIVRSRGALRWALLGLAAWTLWLFTTSAQWRVRHTVELYLATVLVALALASWQWIALRRPPVMTRRRAGAWAAALGVLGLLATQTPTSAESLTLGTAGQTAMRNLSGLGIELALARRLHERIGATTPVTYFAFGSTSYLLGNPTHCRYPSPLFLQRQHARELVSEATWRDNLSCVTEPSSRWLIWDRAWFPPERSPAELTEAIDRTWNCAAAFSEGRYLVCPRRG